MVWLFRVILKPMNEEPIKRFVRLMLIQAQQDRATEFVIAPAPGEVTPIKYKVDDKWYDMAPPPEEILVRAVAELERLANLAPDEHEGVIDLAFGSFRSKWNLALVDGRYVLTPIFRR